MMIYDDIWWYMIIIFLIFPHFFMIFMGIWCMYQLLLDIATPPSQGDERILRWISTGRTTTTTAGLPNPGLTGATLTYRGPREGYGNVWHHYHDQWLTMDHEIDHCEYPNQWSFMWIFTMGLMGIFTFISISDIYKMSDITFININGDIHNDQSWWWMLIKGDACQWWWRVMNGIYPSVIKHGWLENPWCKWASIIFYHILSYLWENHRTKWGISQHAMFDCHRARIKIWPTWDLTNQNGVWNQPYFDMNRYWPKKLEQIGLEWDSMDVYWD